VANVAFPSLGPSPDDRAIQSFPRAPWVLLLDTTSGAFSALENPAIHAVAHRGAVVAKLLLKHGVDVVVGHQMGPHPVEALQRAGVPIHVGRDDLSVRELAELFAQGALPLAELERDEQRGFRGGCGCGHGDHQHH
jgi:predicted Fe-Mo cluster-binding NifX family protein